MDHQQRFVVGVSSRGRPIERTCDHCFVVDHGELVVQLVSVREARSADAFEGLIQRPVTRFYLAGVIWKACLLYTSPSPRDATLSRMPSSA